MPNLKNNKFIQKISLFRSVMKIKEVVNTQENKAIVSTNKMQNKK